MRNMRLNLKNYEELQNNSILRNFWEFEDGLAVGPEVSG